MKKDEQFKRGDLVYNKERLELNKQWTGLNETITVDAGSQLIFVEYVTNLSTGDHIGCMVSLNNLHNIPVKLEDILSPSEYQKSVKGQTTSKIIEGFNAAIEACHGAAKKGGWWNNLQTGESLVGKRNKGELLMLIVSEVSEAMEGERKNLMDDHLPHRKMAEVELADAIIRICDYAGAHGYDLGGAIVEKMEYNAKRADHKPENRAKAGGKQF